MTGFKFRTTEPSPPARAFAWAGGAVFVLSLSYFLYFYMVGLDANVAAPADWRALGFNLVLFGIFAIHHSIMARSGAKDLVARLIPRSLERSSYVWIASVLLFLTCWLWKPLGTRLYQHTGLWRLGHVSVQLAGVWIIARATRMLDPLELAGIRQVLPRAMDAPDGAAGRRDDETISNDGPYGLVRHPIYLGWLLVTFGVPHMTLDRMVFATVSGIYLLVAIPFEERSLIAAYGEPYRRYMEQVRWRIVPYVW